MSDSSNPDQIALERLAQLAYLDDIFFTELSAKREVIGEECSREIDVEMQFRVEDADEGSADLRFRYNMAVEVEHPFGRVKASAAAVYVLPSGKDDLLQNRQALLMFGNEIAVFAVIPYLRHAISDLALRVLGSQLTIPIARRGQFQFELPESDVDER